MACGLKAWELDKQQESYPPSHMLRVRVQHRIHTYQGVLGDWPAERMAGALLPRGWAVSQPVPSMFHVAVGRGMTVQAHGMPLGSSILPCLRVFLV